MPSGAVIAKVYARPLSDPYSEAPPELVWTSSTIDDAPGDAGTSRFIFFNASNIPDGYGFDHLSIVDPTRDGQEAYGRPSEYLPFQHPRAGGYYGAVESGQPWEPSIGWFPAVQPLNDPESLSPNSFAPRDHYRLILDLDRMLTFMGQESFRLDLTYLPKRTGNFGQNAVRVQVLRAGNVVQEEYVYNPEFESDDPNELVLTVVAGDVVRYQLQHQGSGFYSGEEFARNLRAENGRSVTTYWTHPEVILS